MTISNQPAYEAHSGSPVLLALNTSASFSDTGATLASFDSLENNAAMEEVALVPEPGTWIGASLALPFLFWVRAHRRRVVHFA
jgi:hypothetical protein